MVMILNITQLSKQSLLRSSFSQGSQNLMPFFLFFIRQGSYRRELVVGPWARAGWWRREGTIVSRIATIVWGIATIVSRIATIVIATIVIATICYCICIRISTASAICNCICIRISTATIVIATIVIATIVIATH